MTRNDRPGEGRPVQGPDGASDTPLGYPSPLTLGLIPATDPEPGSGLVVCVECGHPTYRVGSDSRPRHSACEPRHVYLSTPETSHQAARVAARSLPKRAELVLGCLVRAGHGGRTDDELAQRLPSEHPGSVAKARLGLVRRGLVADSGRTRPTRRGVEAIVWVVVR